jgi:hypothetical protein
MAERLQAHELETMIRSAAMAPLATETTRRILEAHRELLARYTEMEVLLHRLLPAWGEVRTVLNEMVKRVEAPSP